MIVRNGNVLMPDDTFCRCDIGIGDGVILNAPPATDDVVIDAAGDYVLPGFVDIHSHGSAGGDYCDGSAQALQAMLAYNGSVGVTSILPTAMAWPIDGLASCLAISAQFYGKEGEGAVLRGVNLEGPYLNAAKCGAQNIDFFASPSCDSFDRLVEAAGGQIKLLSVAPELNGAMELIAHAKQHCRVSIAHTLAGFDVASKAFAEGASHVTHLFNAMPPYLHRDPGVIGAAYDAACFVEVISDGFHLHPAVVRGAFAMFGRSRVCLISDSMRAAGMPDGEYDLGGQTVTVAGGRALLADGSTIAGSVLPLSEMCRRAVGFGIPLEIAANAASRNPAKAAGIYNIVGSLESGKRADIVIWDKDLRQKQVICGGSIIA